jgi:hypothetical protein
MLFYTNEYKIMSKSKYLLSKVKYLSYLWQLRFSKVHQLYKDKLLISNTVSFLEGLDWTHYYITVVAAQKVTPERI